MNTDKKKHGEVRLISILHAKQHLFFCSNISIQSNIDTFTVTWGLRNRWIDIYVHENEFCVNILGKFRTSPLKCPKLMSFFSGHFQTKTTCFIQRTFEPSLNPLECKN